jgi:hypothetical protein
MSELAVNLGTVAGSGIGLLAAFEAAALVTTSGLLLGLSRPPDGIEAEWSRTSGTCGHLV